MGVAVGGTWLRCSVVAPSGCWVRSRTSPNSWPTRLTAQTKTPFAMAWARWLICQAEYCRSPNSAFSAGVPADGGGVEEDFGAAECGFAGGFGVPLVPADEGADGTGAGEGGEVAEVAGGEVELFVEEGVVGDVHLAVDGADAIGGGGVHVAVEGDGGVVVEAGGAAFEEGGDEDDAELAADGGEGVGGGAGDGFGEREEGVVFALAEVLGAEELGEADEVGAEVGGFADAADGLGEVEVRVGGHGHLDEGDFGGLGCGFGGHGSLLDV